MTRSRLGAARGAGIGLLTVLLWSCAAAAREPRPVRPESDVCPECRMTVLSGGYAAEAVDGEGTVLVFDDPGCLGLYVRERPDLVSRAAFFVQDALTQAWVPWTQAVFVQDRAVPTPMNYGWHAFAKADQAQTFAAEHGGTVSPRPELGTWQP